MLHTKTKTLSTVKNVILWDFHTQVELYSLNLSLGTQETFPSCPEFFDPPNPLFGAIMYPVWLINGFKSENIHFLLKKSQKITKNAKKYIKLEKNVTKIFWSFLGPF